MAQTPPNVAPLPQEHVEPLRAASLKTLSVVARLRGEATRARVSAAPGAPSPSIRRLRENPESAAEVIEASADPDAAARIDDNDRQRLTRAYEVWLATGRPLTSFQNNKTNQVLNPDEWLGVALTPPRSKLYSRIDRRFEGMLMEGAMEEARELDRLGIKVAKSDPRLDRLLAEVKQKEAEGYAYEAADASFELLARRALGEVPRFFDVNSFRVMVERRHNAIGNLVSVSEAVVKLDIDGESRMSVAEGNGPVNALDKALRKDLGKYQSAIEGLELVDYKVRILNGGTGAVTRVLIESHDTGRHRRWFTIGVSSNIVDASFQALVDSITYALLKAEAA